MAKQESLRASLITGKTQSREREELYGKFRRGEISTLIVSKVGNFAVDLPDANVAIQVSGTFGSRQEEAQRLGRILRPKQGSGRAIFYSVVTRNTRDQVFAEKRQRFLTEQGYQYEIQDGAPFVSSGDGEQISSSAPKVESRHASTRASRRAGRTGRSTHARTRSAPRSNQCGEGGE